MNREQLINALMALPAGTEIMVSTDGHNIWETGGVFSSARVGANKIIVCSPKALAYLNTVKVDLPEEP